VYSESTGWSQSEWKATLQQEFNSSDATEITTQEWVFAGPGQATHYANGALMSSRYFTAAKTWAQEIPVLFAWGIDGSLSGDGGNSIIVDGQPQREVDSIPDSITGLKTTEYLAVGDETWQTVTTTLEARHGLLDPGRPTTIATKRNVNGALVAAPTQKMAYDPTTGLVNRSWTEAGTFQQGQQFTYDAGGRLETVSSYPTGTPSRSTTYTPGTNGLPQSATTTFSTPNGGVNTFTESWTYDAAGRVRTATDGRGATTTVEYDARGRVRSQSANGAAPVTMTYSGERGTSWSSAGLTASESRDGFGRLFERTRADGIVDKPTYDRLGRTVAFRETPTGAPVGGERTATFEYDPLSRTVGTVSPTSPQSTSLTFTADGTSAKVTSLLTNGVASTVWKDPLGQTIKTNDPWSTVTSTYNALGQPKTIVHTADGLSQTRDFNYDALGRLTSRTEPETGLTTFSAFDGLGNPTNINDGLRTRTLAFDGLGRLRTLTNSADASSSSTVFDGLTLKGSTTVSNGQTVTQNYLFNGPGGRLSRESVSGTTNPIQYGYNAQFQLETLTYPSGRIVGYGYDTRGRVNAITQNGLPLATVGYDDAKFGSRNRLTFASGAKSEWVSTANGTHLDSWTVFPNGGPSELKGYTRDENGNLSKASGWDPLKHDAAGRLTEATGFGLSETMVHDGYGNNISSVPNPNSPAQPSNLNHFTFTAMPDNKVPVQTTSPTVASTGWAYRTNGEAISFGQGVGAAAPTVGLTWDGLGRLATATSQGTTWTNTYAPSGMRTQLIDSVTSANNRRYDYTTGGLLLSEYAPSSGGHTSEKSVRVYHSAISPGALSRNLGAFQAGDLVNVSLWFKAPTGVSASVALTDGKPYSADDNKTFKAAPGNGAWQQLTFTWTLTKPATLWLHLYGDMATATSSTATTFTSVQYDGVQVTSIGRSTVMTEGFESGLNVGTDPSSLTTWYSCGQLNELVSSGTLPDTWKRDVIYLGGEAIAEIDANGTHELHNDHLGSPRVITAGATGTVEGRQVFGPYGEKLSANTSGYAPLTGYTGHIQQDPSGLIYMRGRFYSPAWHRFINSDQGVDPMSWNQMAYVGGSPFQATDPSGMYIAVHTPTGNCYDITGANGNGDYTDINGVVTYTPGRGKYNIVPVSCGSTQGLPDFSMPFGGSDRGGSAGGGDGQTPTPQDPDCDQGGDWLDNLGSVTAGWGDALTFGGTSLVRDWMGTNDNVNTNNGWYTAGTSVGMANGIALSGGALGSSRTVGTALHNSRISTVFRPGTSINSGMNRLGWGNGPDTFQRFRMVIKGNKFDLLKSGVKNGVKCGPKK
jgi:RHS repeat-associated protein